MREIKYFPHPEELDSERGLGFLVEVVQEFEEKSSDIYDLIRLAYRLGYQCCANRVGW